MEEISLVCKQRHSDSVKILRLSQGVRSKKFEIHKIEIKNIRGSVEKITVLAKKEAFNSISIF